MEYEKQKRHKQKLLLYALLLLAVMALIFYMSSKNGEDSSQMSGWFAESFLGELLTKLLPKLTDNAITSIRKYAHIFEFLCLGVTSFLFFDELFCSRSGRLGKACAASALWSFLYACSDEWHQTFVPERSGQLSDLRFDAAGFLAGIALTALLCTRSSRKSRHASH